MPRDFLFDIGNVILKFDFSIASDRLLKQMTGSPGNLLDPLEELKVDHESGRIDDETFISQTIELLGFTGTRDEFSRIWCDIFEANEPMSDVIRRLGADGNRLYLISNTSGLHKDFFFGAFPVFECFEGGVYSHTSRSMKPDRQIYLTAFDAFELDPGETIYFDDHVENIEAGKRLGLRSIHYDHTRHDEVFPKMEAAGAVLI